MTPEDLDILRRVGLDDGQILEVVHVVGYFNHINRVADALGVDPEDFIKPAAGSPGVSFKCPYADLELERRLYVCPS